MVVPCKIVLPFSKLFFLFALLAVLCDARRGNHHRNHTKNRIIDGEEVREGDFPEHVVLEITNGGNVKLPCGGVLLKDNIVLTTASCVEGNIFVYVSRSIYSPHAWTDELRSQAIRAETTCITPEYFELDYKKFFDFAILRLEKPFKDAKTAEIAGDEIPIGNSGTALGIGLTHYTDNPKMHERAIRLRKLEMERVECDEYNQGDDHVCFTSKNGGDVCIGDTGSPVFDEEHKVVALTSYSNPDNFCEHGVKAKSVFADVGDNKKLIEDLIDSCLKKPVPPPLPTPTERKDGHDPAIKESKSKHHHHRHRQQN